MPYLNTTTTTFGHTVQDVRASYPETSIPEGASFGEFVWYTPSDPQAHDPRTHLAVEVVPVVGVQQWRIDAIAPAVPASISRAQGKAVLIQMGMWDSVLSFVAAIPDPAERALAEVALHDTTAWQRSSPFLNTAAAALGLSGEQMDAMFVAAHGVEL